MPGFNVWPERDSVEHEDPLSDVIVRSAAISSVDYVDLIADGEVVYTAAAAGRSITVPSSALVDALSRKLRIRLYVDGAQIGGDIIFLPYEESEPYPNLNRLTYTGELAEAKSTHTTDLIDISLVREFVVTGTQLANAVLCLYDEQGNFVRCPLGGGSFTAVHLVPDGTYRYIRASGLDDRDRSLILYFRNRRRV